MMADVKFEVRNNVGWIVLNRPHSLNALSFDMIKRIYEVLLAWENDESVFFVCLKGEGSKSFCAGGDVKRLYELKNTNVHEYAYDFFSTEYKMNLLLHKYEKPIVALMDGFVMGGGVGLGIGAKYRIVTETTKWSMPEMNIGLYPDVGGSYFLSRLPGNIGRYLALTSAIIGYQDAIGIGVADYYMQSSHMKEFESLLEHLDWKSVDVDRMLCTNIKRFAGAVNFETELSKIMHEINLHFKHESIEEILESLKLSAYRGNEWARKNINTMYMKSPTSLKVTLEQLVRGATKSLEECFEMEMSMSMNFMDNDDFFEGVRSVLVDKDHNPEWRLASFSDVTREYVESFFEYEWLIYENPLMVRS